MSCHRAQLNGLAAFRVVADVWEYDDIGANDRIRGEAKRVYMRDIVPKTKDEPAHTAVYVGDGNIVKIMFDVELL